MKIFQYLKIFEILQDGNGEIDQGEMEEVFSKLCRIVNCEQLEVDKL